jgi:S1/P1 Nuclease
MKILFRSVLLIISITILASWGYEGHQTIALIAESHLTPKAKAAVQILLRDQKMTDVASWADDVRNEPEWRYTAPWHFVNVADGLDEVGFKNAVKQQSNPNLYTAILKCEKDLEDPALTLSQKTIALKFLIHFVGDAHQPMHISREIDRGGNTIQLQFDGKGTNLHALWDFKLLDHQALTDEQIAAQVDKLAPPDISRLQNAGPLDWMYESYQLSTTLYKEIDQDNKPGEDYYRAHIPIVDRRLEEAGIRLAGELNRLFKNGLVAKDVISAPQQLPAQTPTIIDARDAAKHYDEMVTVTSRVYGFKEFPNMTLVNLGGEYPDQLVTVVLKGGAKSMAESLSGKTITVTGRLVQYKDKPEIVVIDASQIIIK